MYNTTSKILEAAAVLEKVAAYLEAEEVEEQAKHAAAIQEEYIAPIVEAVGAPRGMEAKLAATDPEVLDFFKSTIAAGRDRGSRYTPMGGAAEKVAAEEGDSLLNFCLGED